MNHRDAEISEVIVVLSDKDEKSIADMVGKLKALGLEVVDVNQDEAVVEGCIDAGRVHDLKATPGVTYVRSVFTYIADYPTGDPRDGDGMEDVQEEQD